MRQLEDSALLAEAASQSGLSNFGDPAFLEPFAIYCASLEGEARLSEGGMASTRHRLLAMLMERARLEEWYRRAPEIEDEDIGTPLFIVGLPRTGTTMLYRMLAAAPGFAAPLHYEAANLTPPFDWNFDPATDPRKATAEAAIAAMMAAVPEIASIYPFDALAPEEDIYLYSSSFCSTSMQSSARVPAYERWFDSAEKAPAYRYLARALKFLQWQRRKSGTHVDGATWLLKTPDHIHSLDCLLSEFPGAKVIQTHRDPVETIPSISSFIRALHRLTSDRVDAVGIGQEWCRMFSRSMNHAATVRTAHPDQFLDILYHDTVRRPREVAERVFAFIGAPLEEPAWREMENWRDANRREERPSHTYTLEEFGLSVDQVESAFATYRAAFLGQNSRNISQ